MEIHRYVQSDEPKLFDLIRNEGGEWEDYFGGIQAEKYRRALQNSIVYVAYEGDVLCGYARCRDDDGYGIYVYDLLVHRAFRGRHIGRKLMERVCADHPEDVVYVMSDVDGYYLKQGYHKEGSIFRVKPHA